MMRAKDPRVEVQNPNAEVTASLKRVERFLRLLTWQLFFLLAILLYLALRPQAGRYQFTVAGEEVVVFDTASSRAVAIKLQKQVVNPASGQPESGAPSVAEENKE